jgi:hypothetical protein
MKLSGDTTFRGDHLFRQCQRFPWSLSFQGKAQNLMVQRHHFLYLSEKDCPARKLTTLF